jgi:capsular exopolysaccharide synthesis family protein
METNQKLQATPRQTSAAASAPKSLCPADSDTHLLDRLNAIYKYRSIVVTVFLLVLMAVLVRTFTTTPMYRATASVLIEDERGASVAGFNASAAAEYMQDPEPYFQTQLRILQGRELGGKVAKRLHLEDVPEFNGQGPTRTGLASVLHTMKVQVQGTLRKVTRGAPSDDALANAFLATVSLEPVRGSRLVNVSVNSSDPSFAALGADALVEEYVKQNLEIRTATTSNRTIYDGLLQRQKELQVVSNGGGNVRLMDRAVVPGGPYTPDVQRNLMLGSLASLLLALGLVLAIDYLDDTVKTPEDITRRLKLPFLGLVPAIKGAGHPLLSQEVPHEFGEAFRALRTSLVFSSGSEGTRVIALTSAQPLEGKTTTACNIAIALAYGGSRVLLIDADMRRPNVSRTLGIENTLGLSHLLTGRATARQAIRRTNVQNLWVMTAGMTPPNPSELLSSERMQTLITNVQSGPFDWVLIDTPPVLAVADAVIVAPWVSGVVFIIGSEMTQRRLVERAVETLQASRPHILGAVLSRVDIARNKFYYSRYYGYKYKNSYFRSNAGRASV